MFSNATDLDLEQFSTSTTSKSFFEMTSRMMRMAIRMSKHFGFRITANNVSNLLHRMRQPSDPFYRNIPYRKRRTRHG